MKGEHKVNIMNLKSVCLIALLSFSSFAFAADDWIHKEVTGDLKPGPGCVAKEKAMKKVMRKPDSYKGYSRYAKYTRLLCEEEGYGWSRESIVNEGEVVCEECGGEYAGKYRCYMKDVTVGCKKIAQ